MLTDTRDSAHDNRPAVTLVGTTAYVQEPKDLLVVDTTSGKPLAKIAEPITSQSLVDQPVTSTAPPIVVDDGSGQLLLSVWVASPASGPTLEVAAVDTTTHALAWSWSAPLGSDNAHPVHLRLLDGKGVALVGAPSQLGGGVTYAIDLSTHGTRWSNQHLIPMAVSGGTLVGDSLTLQDQRATAVCVFSAPGTLGPQAGAIGVDATTGKINWNTTDDFPTVNLVWHGHIYGTLHDSPVLWDATTGKPVPQAISVAPSGVDGFVGLEMAQESGGLLTETAGILKVHRAVS